MTHLSDVLNDANQQGLSSRRISDIASVHGHEVHFSTIARYLKGQHPIPPKIEVLEAFSSALGISVGKLLEAGGLTDSHGRFELPTRADLLDEAERKTILTMIDTILRAKKPGNTKRFAGDIASFIESLSPEDRSRLEASTEGTAAMVEHYLKYPGEDDINEANPERSDFDLAAYEDGGPSAWKHRREEDARRGEESQENPHDD